MHLKKDDRALFQMHHPHLVQTLRELLSLNQACASEKSALDSAQHRSFTYALALGIIQSVYFVYILFNWEKKGEFPLSLGFPVFLKGVGASLLDAGITKVFYIYFQ